MAADLARRFVDLVSLFCKLLKNYLTDFENSKKKVIAFQIVNELEGTSFLVVGTPPTAFKVFLNTTTLANIGSTVQW